MYKGQLAIIKDDREIRLASAGITGISDSYKFFKNSAGIGTLLVFFTETGFAHFASHPINEIFNQSILSTIFSIRILLLSSKNNWRWFILINNVFRLLKNLCFHK